MSIVNLNIIFNLWKSKSRHANAQLKGWARHSFITEMAFFTDYSCETGYPFDNSSHVLIWTWNGFNIILNE